MSNILFVSEEVQKQRKELCDSCEHKSTVFNKIDLCNQCGCIIPAKIKLIDANCPINKWHSAR